MKCKVMNQVSLNRLLRKVYNKSKLQNKKGKSKNANIVNRIKSLNNNFKRIVKKKLS